MVSPGFSSPLSRVEIAFVLAISLCFALCIWRLYQPAHALQLGSDQRNIAAFASADEHPERYARDDLLGTPTNYQWYTPVYVSAVRWITRFTGGYAATFAGLFIPTITLFLSGAYFLLRYLTGSRLLSAGFAFLITVICVHVPPSTGGWRLLPFQMMLPRSQFIALLPWLLLFALWCRKHIRFWPLLGACAASLIYVHPVSAPAWGMAIFGGILWSSRRHYPLKQRALGLGLMALAAVVVILPYISIYGSTYTSKTPPADQYEVVYDGAEQRFAEGYLDVRLALKMLLQTASSKGERFFSAFLLMWMSVGLLFVWRDREQGRHVAEFLVPALLFFLLITVGMTAVDQIVARRLQHLPVQLDLIRGLKFWPWWALLLGASGFPAFQASLLRKSRHSRLLTAGLAPLILLLAWLAGAPGIVTSQELVFQRSGASTFLAERVSARDEVVRFIAEETPIDSLFHGPDYLRFTPGRSLVFHYKDLGALFYSNYEGAMDSQARQEAWEHAERWKERERLCRSWGVDYVVQWNRRPTLPTRPSEKLLVFSNAQWEVFYVSAPQEPNDALYLSATGGRTGIALTPRFHWEANGSTADHFNFYLWKQGEQRPDSPLLSEIRSTSIVLAEALEAGVTYFWTVDAVNANKTTKGPLSFFRTD